MRDSDKEHLINEIVHDLEENPEDSWHIINGLKEGYPDIASEVALEVLYRLQDRKLLRSAEVQQGLAELRRGEVEPL